MSWQRRQAGPRNGVKAKQKVARHQLANDDRYRLFVFDAMKIQGMTKRAKPKQEEQGRWLRNGAKAKAGLNKAILASAWGKAQSCLPYKT